MYRYNNKKYKKRLEKEFKNEIFYKYLNYPDIYILGYGIRKDSYFQKIYYQDFLINTVLINDDLYKKYFRFLKMERLENNIPINKYEFKINFKLYLFIRKNIFRIISSIFGNN